MTAAAQAERLAKWQAALRRHFETAPRGKVSFVEVQHENWCPTQRGLPLCLCNPDRVILDDQRRVLTRIRGAGPYRVGEVGEPMV